MISQKIVEKGGRACVYGTVRSVPLTITKAQSQAQSWDLLWLSSIQVVTTESRGPLTHLLDTAFPMRHASRVRDTEACKNNRPHVARKAGKKPKSNVSSERRRLRVDFLLHGGNILGSNKRSIMSLKHDAAATDVEG